MVAVTGEHRNRRPEPRQTIQRGFVRPGYAAVSILVLLASAPTYAAGLCPGSRTSPEQSGILDGVRQVAALLPAIAPDAKFTGRHLELSNS